MATATKRVAPARRPAEKSTLDYLQRALDDLDHARGHAQQDARASIDNAVDRIRDAVKDIGSRAQDEAHEWQDRLEHVSAEARLELGRAAIRAQGTPEALTELAAEVRRRKQALSA
jgi:acetyl-CoA carboxylase alpha subunit